MSIGIISNNDGFLIKFGIFKLIFIMIKKIGIKKL